ncbi:MAG: DNRLRE domain-containing protein [Anaerolineae bacterium]|nr:DNRLRE domain-containing protein [Anaerolineae bacterium]
MSKMLRVTILTLVFLAFGVLRVGATAEFPSQADAPPQPVIEPGASLPAVEASTVCRPLAPGGDTAYKATLTAVRDSYVSSHSPDTNYGTNATMMVGGISIPYSAAYHTLAGFDLTVLPADVVILTATLELYQTGSSGNNFIITAQALTGAWTETGVTWNNKPGFTTLDEAVEGAAEGDWRRWDITSLAQKWHSGALDNNGMRLVFGMVSNQTRTFSSRQGTYAPRLVVEYQRRVTLNIQSDTYISQADPDTNYGSESTVFIARHSTTYQEQHTLLRFAALPFPTGSTVISAVLELHTTINLMQANVPQADFTVAPEAILNSWGEGTVKWSNAPGSDGMGDPSVPFPTFWPSPFYFDVTNIVQGWASGALLNYGIKLVPDGSETGYVFFDTREYGPGINAPTLIITYGPPPCYPATSVNIGGATLGVTDTVYTFTASISPLDATPPIDFSWEADEQTPVSGSSVEYTWDTPGTKMITVTVSNCESSIMDTHLVTITVPEPTCPVPLTALSLSGPTQGITDTAYTFNVQASPTGATKPVTYTWLADEQAPSIGGGQVIKSYTWDTPGTKHITVTVWNCGGSFTQYHSIDVIPRDQLPDLRTTDMWYNALESRVYYVVKNSGGTTAPAGFTVNLTQAISEVAQSTLAEALHPGWVRAGSLAYDWQCAASAVRAMVCADSGDAVLEGDEANNCYEEWWSCDMDSPQITSGPTIVETTEHTAVIAWTTNEPCRSRIDYSYGNYVPYSQADNTLKTDHQVTLQNLLNNRTYWYRLYVTDEAGNLANTNDNYFETQPPGTDPIVIGTYGLSEYASNYYEFYTLYADVSTDPEGVDRVSFFLDGQLIGRDYSPDGNRYEVYVSPAAMGLTRAEWFTAHTLQVQAYNLEGEVTGVNKSVTPPVRPAPGKATIVSPSASETIYVAGDPAIPGTTLDTLVYGAQYAWKCTDSSYSEGGAVPPGLQAVSCNPLRKNVSMMQLYLDGNLAGTYVPTTGVFDHTFTVNLSGKSAGTHTLRFDIQTSEGNSHSVERQIELAQGTSDLKVERAVTRNGNAIQVTLTLRNNGTTTAYVQGVQDFVRGLQVIETSNMLGLMSPTANYYRVRNGDFGNLPERTIMIDLFTGSADEIPLGAGESFNIIYDLVPVLYQEDEAYYIGAEPSNQNYAYVWHRDATEPEHGWSYFYAHGNWVDGMPLETVVQQIAASSDYIIVTSPAQLSVYTTPIDWRASQGTQRELSLVLSRMAELATLRNGVLGFLPASPSADTLDRLLEKRNNIWGAWAGALHPNFRTYHAGGYVLFVGEDEVVPAQAASHSEVPYSDLKYASTSGASRPELVLGRIVGDDLGTLREGLDNSISVIRSVVGFDRQRALISSGRGSGAGTFWTHANEIANRLNFASVTRLKWTNYATAAEMLADFKLEFAQGQGLVVYRGHGNASYWQDDGDVGFHTGHIPGFDFNGYHPFVFGLACSTGDYRNSYSMPEAWLRYGAALYIGAVSTSDRTQNGSAGRAFFNRWGDDSSLTIGYAFTDMARDHWGDDSEWRKWIWQYHMFGDPKFGALPTLNVAAMQPTVPNGPVGAIQVEVPDFVVTTDEAGVDYVEIPEGGDWLSPTGYIVPSWKVTYTYHQGQRVQDVVLTAQSGLTVVTGLNIPTYTPELDCDCFAPEMTALQSTTAITSWYPQFEQPYAWSILENPDGTSELELRIYPFTYNPATTNARFFKDWSFDVDVFTTTVDILSLGVPQGIYPLAETVTATLVVQNDGAVQPVVVRPVVTAFDDEVSTVLPLRTLHEVTGTATLDLAITETLAAGDYALHVTLADMDGHVLDTEVAEFTVGVVAGEVTSLTAEPALFVPGDDVDIAMTFHNTGDVTLDGVAVIRVQSSDGVTQTAEFTHTLGALAPGATANFDDVWDSTGALSETYRVLGYVEYNLGVSAPQEVIVSTRTHIYLPLVLRNY